jgi:hypothetical protein
MIIIDEKFKQIKFNYKKNNLIEDYKISSPISFYSNQIFKIGEQLNIDGSDCYIKDAKYKTYENEYEIAFRKSDINSKNNIIYDYLKFDYIETNINETSVFKDNLFTSLYVLTPINFDTTNILEAYSNNGNIITKLSDDLEKYFNAEFDDKFIDEDGNYNYVNLNLETLKFNNYFFKSYMELNFSCPFKFSTKILLVWSYAKTIQINVDELNNDDVIKLNDEYIIVDENVLNYLKENNIEQVEKLIKQKFKLY